MSVATLTITTQVKDGGQSNYGAVLLELLINGTVYNLSLSLSPSSGYKKFQEVLWFSPTSSANYAQSQVYATAFNRDYKSTGGVKNLSARIVGSTVEITANVGTLQNGSYTGNILEGVAFSYDNSVQEPLKTFDFTSTGEGGCSTVEYRVQAASGGTAPYRLTLGGVNVVEGWDGNEDIDFDLLRSGVFNGGLYDVNNALIEAVSINPTKNINSADFKQRITPYVGYSDLRIETVVPRAGTGPITYNLIDENGAETGWQSSDTFGGISPGTYTVKIRDQFLCEVSRTFPVVEITSPLEENRVPYFKISEYNSLSYFNEVQHSDTIRKNYENTPSWCEEVALAKNGVFKFPVSSKLPQQFRSSYSHHRATLFRRGLPALNLQFFEIQTNLGVVEKVDCKLFLIAEELETLDGGTVLLSSGTGIYFEGGTQYEPSSTTPKTDPNSPYNGGLPSWAQKGNIVNIDGKGSFEILETDLYDVDREVLYFKIEAKFPDQDALIQSSWDRHPYNVFRFNLDMANVFDEGAFIRVEPGIMSGEDFLADITKIHRSEYFARIDDTRKYIKIEYSAFRNIGEMMFTDGIVCEMWLKGRMRPFSDTDASTDEADDRTNSLDQEAYLRMRGFFPMISARQWRKLDLIGAIGNRGQVFIEGMELIRLSSSEQDEQGVTNLSNVSVDFAFSGESTAIGQEDPIYSIDTGLTVNPGSTGKTGRAPVEDWEVEGGEKRLATVEGEWITVVDTDGNENYIIIP